MRFKKFLLNLLFPIKCLCCGEEGNWLCSDCFSKLQALPSPEVSLKRSPLNRIIVPYDYQNDLIRRLISVYKYNFVPEIGPILARLVIPKLKIILQNREKKNFILIPIPLHSRRLRFRGFNQAEILARSIAQKLDLKMKNDTLGRRRAVLPQVQLSEKERQQNIRKAFSTKKDLSLENKIIILVDDVWTTGATLKEAARTLRAKNKPREIWGLVVAKG